VRHASDSEASKTMTIATLGIGRLTTQERIDLIGKLWDSLSAEDIQLTPAQESELAQRIAAFDLAHDDLAWAKPYVDEAIAQVERGEVMTLDEHNARMDALMKKLGAT
jgi:antitoxin ParD1/3/4